MGSPRRPGRSSAGSGRRRGRLSHSADFERVTRQGRARANRWFVLYAFPRPAASHEEDGGEPRLGMSVSRRVGGAVERNRLKRLLREAFRAANERLPACHDYVVVARPGARELVEREGLEGVERALVELVPTTAPERSGRGAPS